MSDAAIIDICSTIIIIGWLILIYKIVTKD
jgi:hypothetical protein